MKLVSLVGMNLRSDMTNINKAIKLAKKIPSGKKTKAKCKAVHAWHKAVIEMLAVPKK